jgi:CubicO group peptidase (beta-lactamase class C family)
VTPFPEPGAWHDARPAACGLHPDRLADAVRLARTAETRWPVDLGAGLSADPQMNEPAPWNEVLGPTRPRGGPSGMIVRRGQVAARWGDPARVDMTFSVAKSYLALLAGVAVARGLIASVDDPVCASVPHPLLDSPHNARVTWRHLLQQTSEWEGTLWDKPDLVDRNRQVGPGADNSRKGTHRDLGAPGSFWEYNDVRVNLLSLMLLHVFRRPLPEVLAETIMEPIGATGSWEWLAYRNARAEIDGHTMPSVPGGAHWGGGLVISAEDHARVGLLVARDGLWAGRTRAVPVESGLRLPVVAEHRARLAPGRAGIERLRDGRGAHDRLGGCPARPRGRGALDRRRSHRRHRGASDRGARRLSARGRGRPVRLRRSSRR